MLRALKRQLIQYLPKQSMMLFLLFLWYDDFPMSLNIHLFWKLTGNYKSKWLISHKHGCISPFKCGNLEIQMCLWFANWHLQAFNELSSRKIKAESTSALKLLQSFVPTLLKEDAEVLKFFFFPFFVSIPIELFLWLILKFLGVLLRGFQNK